MTPNDRLPSVIPLEFWVDYEPQADGTIKEIERVEWTRKGTQNATTRETIERLSRTGPNGQDPIWLALKPFYDSWKSGREAPVDGTPLAAWPGATPQLVKALLPLHIRSVEDLANLTDGNMDRVPVPGIRGFRNQAKAFLEAQKTTHVVAAEMASRDAQIAEQNREIAELKELVTSLAASQGVDVTDEPKRGPGRPRKVA